MKTARGLASVLALFVSSAVVAACGSGGGGGSGSSGLNHDATLSALTISSGELSPAFDPRVTSYVVDVDFSVRTVKLLPTVHNVGAHIRVDLLPVESGHETVPLGVKLEPETSHFAVEVTAADGFTKQLYDVEARRALYALHVTAIKLSEGSFSPAFNPDILDYVAEVDFPTTSVTVTVMATESTAIVKVNGVEMTPGETSSPIPLAVNGANTILVSLSGTDGSQLQEYVILVRRHADSRLSALTATTGVLSPAFDPEKLDYSLTIGMLEDSVRISTTPRDSAATQTQNGSKIDSGELSAPYTFAVATPSRKADVVVTASDGTTERHYTVSIYWSTNTSLEAYVKTFMSLPSGLGGAIAASGSTIVVGAYDSSSATGVNGDRTNTAAPASGAAFVYVRSGTTWEEQAYLKASNTDASDGFGSVAISGDTIVVGAAGESSAAAGVDGNASDNSAPAAGAAYVFVRNGTTWTQQAYLKASNPDAYDEFGRSVAISGDTIVVGAMNESSAATGVNGTQTDNSLFVAGAAYVFVRNGSTWSQQAYLKASNTAGVAGFGSSVAIDGERIVVGAPNESGTAKGVNGTQTTTGAPSSGAAYVFVRSGSSWSQEAYLKASNAEKGDMFGNVAISGDTIAVGAPNEASAATGIDGNQADNTFKRPSSSQGFAGAVYVFARISGSWTQQAYVKASNTGPDHFGTVSLQGDFLAVGAAGEGGNGTGTGGDGSDDSLSGSGAVYVFRRGGTTWAQLAYQKASNTDSQDRFGAAVAFSGERLVVGAPGEASAATTIGGDQTDNTVQNSGAVYVFR